MDESVEKGQLGPSRGGEDTAADSATPTAPRGIPRPGQAYFAGDLDVSAAPEVSARAEQAPPEDETEDTPPMGIEGLTEARGVLEPEDFGRGAPAVFGAEEPAAPQPDAEAGDWPRLEYRSRNKPQRKSALGWLRRRDTRS